MRITVLLLLAGLGSRQALAQAAQPRPALSGRVVNSAQQPLAGVSVLARGTTLGTSTNADGVFLLPALPPGPLVLRFELGGYLTTDVPLTDTTSRLAVRLLSTRAPLRARRN